MKKKDAPPQPPTLTVTFNWTGEIPKKIARQFKALLQPRTFTFKIPKG